MTGGGAVRTAVLVAGMMGASLLSLQAQPQTATPPVRSVFVSAGVFRPADAAFRAVYGSRAPVAVQAEWRVAPHVAVFGGVRFVRGRGNAVVETGAGTSLGPGLSETVRLGLTSGRAGVLLIAPRGRWEFAVGGGVTVTGYSEDWDAADLHTNGTSAGWMLQARLSRNLTRRLFVTGGIEYGSATVSRSASDVIGRVRLGGLDALGGVGLRW